MSREIRWRKSGTCPVCRRAGSENVHFDGLTDQLFGVSGTWRLLACDHCRSLYLDPHPVVEDIPLLYESYYTHAPVTGTSKRSTGKDLRSRGHARFTGKS